MDAVNKERRDIKVCSSRAAERQLKGGGRGAEADGISSFPQPLRRRFTTLAGGAPTGGGVIAARLVKAAACGGPGACLITAHYAAKSDNNPHAAAGCSPGRSNAADRNTDQLPGEGSHSGAAARGAAAVAAAQKKTNKDGGNESGNASQSRRGDVLERFFSPDVPVCAHAFTASRQSGFWQPDNPTESNLPSWQRLLLDPRRNKIYQEHLRMLLNGAPNLLISSSSRGASSRRGASYV